MKFNILLAAISATALLSCQKQINESKTSSADSVTVNSTKSETAVNQLRIDSVRVADSVKISNFVTADFQNKSLVFTGLNKIVLDSLYNSGLAPEATKFNDFSKKGIETSLKNEMQDYFDDVKKQQAEYSPSFKQTWSVHSDMSVFSNENQYLTVKYSGDGYSGGAHGYAYEQYKVVDVKNQKKLMLNDILDASKVDWNKILLKNIGDGSDALFEKDKLTYNHNFFFDKDKITFSYGQYEIAAYVYGIIEIAVPFSEISGALKPEFKQRMGIK